jgi:hypothetical protein
MSDRIKRVANKSFVNQNRVCDDCVSFLINLSELVIYCILYYRNSIYITLHAKLESVIFSQSELSQPWKRYAITAQISVCPLEKC